MIMAVPMMQENIWFDKWRCDEAERHYQEKLSGVTTTTASQVTKKAGSAAVDKPASSLVSEIARAREQIQKSLNQEATPPVAVDNTVISRIETLEEENKELRKVTEDLRCLVKNLENRVQSLESSPAKPATHAAAEPQKEKDDEGDDDDDDDDDDDFELFGSGDDEEDDEAEKLKQKRLDEYAAKKSKKTQVIAKSSIVFDVKPWDDETDMKAMEEKVRTIEMDGLLWGASKLVPVGYGIRKLQIGMVVEDEKVSIDELQETVEEFEDYVQSVDIAAFNKI